MALIDLERIQTYGKVYGEFFGGTPTLVVADLDMLRQILVKNFSSFPNRRSSALRNKPLDAGLGVLQNEQWKNVRTSLTPAFSGSKMRAMSSLLNYIADGLIRNLDIQEKEDKAFDCKDLLGKYVMDSVISTGFGIDIDSQSVPDHPFVTNVQKAMKFKLTDPVFVIAFFFPFLSPILNYFDIIMFPKDARDYLLKVVDETVELRRNDASQKRVDFMQLMLDANEVYKQYIKDGEDKEDADEKHGGLLYSDKNKTSFHKGFTNEEITAQAFTFFLAGYDTTSTLMSQFAYCMAVNPDIQEKVQSEIDDVMEGYKEPGYEAVNKMTYLDMVVSETLRMYPPGFRFDRKCSQDTVINGIKIPKDILVGIPAYAIHHDPELYPNPSKFDPDRFTKEEKEKRHPYAYLPFGAGPRSCIAMRFALLNAKVGLVRILQKFSFEPCAETEIPLKIGITKIDPTNGIKLKVKSRQ
ncbi:cytochrome P450 3A24-like isoform X2 [Glandiceps talaboti]